MSAKINNTINAEHLTTITTLLGWDTDTLQMVIEDNCMEEQDFGDGDIEEAQNMPVVFEWATEDSWSLMAFTAISNELDSNSISGKLSRETAIQVYRTIKGAEV